MAQTNVMKANLALTGLTIMLKLETGYPLQYDLIAILRLVFAPSPSRLPDRALSLGWNVKVYVESYSIDLPCAYCTPRLSLAQRLGPLPEFCILSPVKVVLAHSCS